MATNKTTNSRTVALLEKIERNTRRTKNVLNTFLWIWVIGFALATASFAVNFLG